MELLNPIQNLGFGGNKKSQDRKFVEKYPKSWGGKPSVGNNEYNSSEDQRGRNPLRKILQCYSKRTVVPTSEC